MMDLLLPCRCGQSYPPDRDQCPYCGNLTPVTWVHAAGKLNRIVEYCVDGQPYVHCDGVSHLRTHAVQQGFLPKPVKKTWGLLGWRAILYRLLRPRQWSNKSV